MEIPQPYPTNPNKGWFFVEIPQPYPTNPNKGWFFVEIPQPYPTNPNKGWFFVEIPQPYPTNPNKGWFFVEIPQPYPTNPNKGWFFVEIPQPYHIFALFYPQKVGNLIAPWYSKNPEFFGTEICSSIFVGVTFSWWVKQEGTEAPTSFDNPSWPQNNLQVLYVFCFYYVPIDFQSYLVRLGVWIPKNLLRRLLGDPNTYSPGTRRISDA